MRVKREVFFQQLRISLLCVLKLVLRSLQFVFLMLRLLFYEC